MPPIRRSNLGRITRNATNQANYRSNQSPQERDDRNERERIRISQTREARTRNSTNNRASLNRAAFSYDVSIDYSNYQCVVIGSMNSVCSHCKALKYKNEANGLCCANGKVKLIPLDPPPEPLYSLVSGIGTDSIHFLTNIQQYNNCFQMTSFGATNVVRENFMPTFKVCIIAVTHNYFSEQNFLSPKLRCVTNLQFLNHYEIYHLVIILYGVSVSVTLLLYFIFDRY